MKVVRSELLGALEAVKGAVAEKAFIPILTHVLIQNDSVLGYNSEIGIKVKLPSPVGNGITFNARFATLYNLIRNLDNEEIDFAIEGKKIKIACGSHKSHLMQIEEEFPKPPVKLTKESWRDVPAGFVEALERTLIACSDDDNNKQLSAVLIKGSRLYSTDKARLVRCTVEGLSVEPAMLLPRKAALELVRLGNPRRVAVTGPLAVFDLANLTFIARLREGIDGFPMPLIDSVLANRKATDPLPEGLTNALTRLMVFTDKETSGVEVASEALGLRINVISETQAAEEFLPAPKTPVDAKGFNPVLLFSALPFADGIEWGKGGNSPIYLSGAISGFEFLLSPMQLGRS